MRYFFFIFTLAALVPSCRSVEYYTFKHSEPFASEGAPLEAKAEGKQLSNTADKLFAATAPSIDKGEKKEALTLLESTTKYSNQPHSRNPGQYYQQPLPAVVKKNDVVSEGKAGTPTGRPNAAAHVSFFSAVVLIILLLFTPYVPLLTPILFLTLSITGFVTSQIALRQIVRKNENGRALARFGMTISALAFFIIVFSLIASSLV